ncbi:hypothetical protein REPUB_Repub15cG0070500 [Reevesia pubescens]
MLDRRAAKLELDARDARLSNRKLPQLLHDQDTDDDNYRPSKRSRADLRPPAAPRSYDDTNGIQSSPGRSQPGHSRDDVPMTDRTDDYPYEEKIQEEFKPMTFDVKFQGKNYRCATPKLNKEIVPEKCKVVIKPTRVIITLFKASKENWSDLHFKEDKLKPSLIKREIPWLESWT